MLKKVYVSMTSLPSRLQKITSIITNIIEKQTYKVDNLSLYIPYKSLRTGEEYIIPEELNELERKYENFNIKFCDKDYGPIMKILPCLIEHENEDCIIITIDDDILLESHSIEEMINYHNKYNNSLLGFMGVLRDGYNTQFYHSELINEEIKQVIQLGGYRSILYPRKLIDNNFYKYYEELTEIHKEYNIPILDDDYFISNYFNKKNIDMYIIRTNYPGNLESYSIYNKINIVFLDTSNIDSLNYNQNISNKLSLSTKLINDYFLNLN